MKLYLDARAPSPRRVRLYLAEKTGGGDPAETWPGLVLVDVDLRAGEHLREPYVAINPNRVVPALVLDDGTVIGESLAICRTFEAMVPSPPLFGRDAREVGLVEMWIRRIEQWGYVCVRDAYRNSRPGFAGRALPGSTGDVPQIPALVERANDVFARSLRDWNEHLADREWFVDAYSMADVMALTTLDFARRVKMAAAAGVEALPHLRRWHAAASARPGATE